MELTSSIFLQYDQQIYCTLMKEMLDVAFHAFEAIICKHASYL